MKKSDFREITPEMIHFAKTLKSNGGICGLKCNNCPFSDANSHNDSDCTEKYATPDYNFGDIAYAKDKLLEKSAKKFLKLVEKDIENIKSVYKLIKEERKRQNKLHPNFAKSETERIAILLEEVGEVAKAFNDGDVDNYKTELIQVAAVCVRMIEEGN